MLPIRIALIAPADYARPDSEIMEAHQQVIKNMVRINQWFADQSGYVFRADVQWWRSEKTQLELATAPDGAWSDVNDCGDHWVGMHETTVSREARAHFFGPDPREWTEIPGTRTMRLGVYVLGGGGFAGGRFTQRPEHNEDLGQWMLGDWEIIAETWGEPEPCCLIWKGRTFCMRSVSNPGLSFGHEMGHGMGLGDIHSPIVLWLGTNWLDIHKQNYLTRNKLFIEPVGAPPAPPPEPVPVPDPLPEPEPDPIVIVGTRFVPNARTLKRGHGRQYRLRATFSDGEVRVVAAQWGSSDVAVATVGTNDGKVVAVGRGEVEIHAHVEGHDAHFALKVRR